MANKLYAVWQTTCDAIHAGEAYASALGIAYDASAAMVYRDLQRSILSDVAILSIVRDALKLELDEALKTERPKRQ